MMTIMGSRKKNIQLNRSLCERSLRNNQSKISRIKYKKKTTKSKIVFPTKRNFAYFVVKL